MTSGPQPQPTPPGVPEPSCCEITRAGDVARVRLLGDLDLAAAPLLEAELDALRTGGVRHLILDLSNLDFMDSTGLRCILECDAEGREDGFRLALVPGPPAVQRVFELTQTVTRLSFIDP